MSLSSGILSRTFLVVGLSCGLFLSVLFEASADEPVAESLAPFRRGTKPVPNPIPVKFYIAFPNAGGTPVRGLGHSGQINSWFLSLGKSLQPWLADQRDVALEANRMIAKISKDGPALMTRLEATSDDSWRRLNRELDGRIHALVNSYLNEMANASSAAHERGAALDRVDAAVAVLLGATSRSEAFKLEVAKARLVRQKAGLEQTADRGRRLIREVTGVLDAVPGGVGGVVRHLGNKAEQVGVDTAVELIFAEEMARIRELEAMIEAMDEVIKHEEFKIHADDVTAAKHNLAASRKVVFARTADLINARVRAWNKIDELLSMSEGSPVGRVLEMLHAYNRDVHRMGMKMNSAAGRYNARLERPPFADGRLVSKMVDSDVAEVERFGRDPYRAWTALALQTKTYLDEYCEWYRTETENVYGAIRALHAGTHLRVVDAAIQTMRKKLGGTSDAAQIIH